MISLLCNKFKELKFQANLVENNPINRTKTTGLGLSKGPYYSYDCARRKDLELVGWINRELYIIPVEVKIDKTFNWIVNLIQCTAYNYINYKNHEYELVSKFWIIMCPSLAVTIDFSKCSELEQALFDFFDTLKNVTPSKVYSENEAELDKLLDLHGASLKIAHELYNCNKFDSYASMYSTIFKNTYEIDISTL